MPTFTVRGPRKVREGQDAVWRLKLSQQLDITWFLGGRLVKGRGTAARVDDLDRRWLRQHHVEAPPRTPVHKAHVGLDEIIWPGQTEVVLRVGTRDDDRDEGRETLRMEIRYFDTVVRRTVRIVDGDGDG
jgi:hypothetical protein